ncbi:unnamed protein product [Acanthoscelides obtectus]|uniref:HTH iclR-type domain-containing protein n=1 Tax=Acanthoscelides obtectus TaxID=200917 RepID=A0A9P0K8Z7_ACAOB|nr:unnamed protein product [Acanthoscelides obtectus]CAH1968808.1 unnamed protein product [Acanthoscelides obtectus]CAK1683106.1 hypothetical protein AOBTE_LOCUS34083 [Acanthoscelides obtectus]CAK1683107.1 hypothetical protein AOBTE_LOCUS34084 [Acanthoscelides obtectus]
MANRRPDVHCYTASEYADMHLVYGETRRINTRGGASYSARKAARIYAERNPNRQHPAYGVFLRVHDAYSQGRFPGGPRSEGRPRRHNDDVVVEHVTTDPSTSLRAIERRTGIPRSSAHRILQTLRYHPYQMQKVQFVLNRDYAPRVQFFAEKLSS